MMSWIGQRASLVACILVVPIVTSCASPGEKLAGWVGHQTDDLVTYWGPPAATYEMEDGREVLAYSAQQQYQVQGPGIPVPFSGTYWCEVTYTADTSGRILSSAVKGKLGGCNALLRRKGLPPE